MDPFALLVFGLAVGLATASPGPTVAALLARVLARGAAGALPFCAGLVLGDLAWLAAAVLGLSVLAQAAQPVFVALKWLGVATLLWLAWRMWTAPAEAPGEGAAPVGEGPRLALGGLALALGNPKTMVFYTALAPALVDMAGLTSAGFAGMASVLALVYAAVLAGYVALAARARRLLRSARAVRRVNRACGAAMAGAAAAVAAR